MKMKFVAAFALAAWLLVAGWLASMVIAKPAVLRLGNQAEDSAAMAELRNAIARNRKTMEGLETLRQAAVPYQGTGPLIALPANLDPAAVAVATGSGVGAAAVTTAGLQAPAPEPQLSLVLDTGQDRVAVFNGEQVRRGSRLANGDQVLAIGPDWISVYGRDRKRTVYRIRSQFEPVEGGSQP
ncbi:MAG TPA: hypothetical protein VFF91_09170 [Pseudoxanthomonas sp.]|nr:hypothetical protein [Pseudoxanthomonas sp.]